MAGKFMMLVLYGPTATGKTDLALQLAGKFHGELISADSRQVYTGLDIGTGKVGLSSKVEKHERYWLVDGIRINGFDLIDPGKQFTAADFVKFANNSIVQTIELKKLPIIVGGTGFYIKALLQGLNSFGIAPDPDLRSRLEKLSKETLFQKLAKINPNRAEVMNESDRQNPRRLVRAIEIAMHKKYQVSGIRYQVRTKYKIPDTKYLLIGLTAPNNYLFTKADGWLKKRMDNCLVEEVESLIRRGVSKMWLESLGLEYRWITRFLTKQITKDQAIQRLRGDIHDFIRRQKTFFRQFANSDIQIFDISASTWQSKLEKKVQSWYISHSLQASA